LNRGDFPGTQPPGGFADGQLGQIIRGCRERGRDARLS
jgi:hypothetical protein